jgi:hypothetical protein
MSSRFLGTQNATGITDGTLNIKGATIAADNLVTGKPVRANAAKQIVSTDLLISDVQGLQTVLDNPSFEQVTVSEDILPENDDESDIGQPAKRFKHGYFVALTPSTINGPVSIAGGDLSMQIRKITNLAAPTSSADATTKTYVDTADNLKLNLTGGTLSGQLECRDLIPSTTNLFALGTSGRKFADLQTTNATIGTANMTFGSVSSVPASGTDVANKTYVDTQRDTRLALTGGTLTGPINSLRTNDTSIQLGSATVASSGTNTIQIGVNAGDATLGNGAIAIGDSAANTGGGNFSVTIGRFASGFAASKLNTISIGNSANGTSGGNINSIAIGETAGNSASPIGITSIQIGKGAGSSAGSGLDSIAIGTNTSATGGSAIAIGANSASTGDEAIAIGKSASCIHTNSIVMNANLGTPLQSTVGNQIRVVAGLSVIDAVPKELKFASGAVTANASMMESWWAHNLLQNTAMPTNTATTTLRVNTATSFYFPPALATAGLNSMVPVVINGTAPNNPPAITPVHFMKGTETPFEWVQNTFAITANAAGPSTTGGNRVRWTYGGATARRFDMTVTGSYQTTSNNQLTAFQGIIRTVGATNTFINGTASPWFQTDTNRVFIAVSRKMLLVSPGDIFEVAMGYDPSEAPNQLNNTIVRDMTVVFTSTLVTN